MFINKLNFVTKNYENTYLTVSYYFFTKNSNLDEKIKSKSIR